MPQAPDAAERPDKDKTQARKTRARKTARGRGSGSGSALPSKPPRLSMRSSYSLFVGTMKLVLPALAVAIVLVVVVWPQIAPDERSFRVGVSDLSPEDAGTLTMTNARFQGHDEQGRPFTVSAGSASQASSGADRVQLDQVQADITLSDGAWVSVTADRGTYRREAEDLTLEGRVNLFHDRGFEMRTQRVEVDLNAGRAVSTTPVEGQGPAGTVTAEGFRVLDQGERIEFTGQSRLKIFADRVEEAG
jgi:lipopolysaccharide export system protein LptC